jgi:hypothetical protein
VKKRNVCFRRTLRRTKSNVKILFSSKKRVLIVWKNGLFVGFHSIKNGIFTNIQGVKNM